MKSWLYLFSQFTSEALLLESVAILTLLTAYLGFWIVRKRRYGSVDQQVPTGVVRSYLNALIVDAHSLRTQLFGLLADAGIQIPSGVVQRITAASAGEVAASTSSSDAGEGAATVDVDPEFGSKLEELQTKLDEQVKATDEISEEKKRLEQELAQLKAAGGGGGGEGSGANDDQLKELQKKIAALEEKLAEYSVIEDDLANLKRLQQENAQLKEQLAKATGQAPAPPAADEKAAATTETPEAPAAPEAAAAEKAANANDAGTAKNDAFEGLVDQVEQSLQDAPAADTGGESAPPTDEQKKKEKSPIDSIGGNDEDLLSDFEKMLNS